MKICSNCGTTNGNYAKTCSKCGHSLINEEYQKVSNSRLLLKKRTQKNKQDTKAKAANGISGGNNSDGNSGNIISGTSGSGNNNNAMNANTTNTNNDKTHVPSAPGNFDFFRPNNATNNSPNIATNTSPNIATNNSSNNATNNSSNNATNNSTNVSQSNFSHSQTFSGPPSPLKPIPPDSAFDSIILTNPVKSTIIPKGTVLNKSKNQGSKHQHQSGVKNNTNKGAISLKPLKSGKNTSAKKSSISIKPKVVIKRPVQQAGKKTTVIKQKKSIVTKKRIKKFEIKKIPEQSKIPQGYYSTGNQGIRPNKGDQSPMNSKNVLKEDSSCGETGGLPEDIYGLNTAGLIKDEMRAAMDLLKDDIRTDPYLPRVNGKSGGTDASKSISQSGLVIDQRIPESLDEILVRLSDLDLNIEASALVDIQGNIHASAISKRISDALIATIGNTLGNISQDMINSLDAGDLHTIVLMASRGILFLAPVMKNLYLLLYTGPNAKIGIINVAKIQCKKALELYYAKKNVGKEAK